MLAASRRGCFLKKPSGSSLFGRHYPSFW